jgi:EmrB/QacA subfamily drug resistance transporter
VPRRSLVLAICCLSLFIVSLDITIVNVALPVLRTDLKASVAGLQWVLDAYPLVVGSLLVLAGSTGDRIGRRRVFQTGLVLFSVASLLCSLAPSLGWLIAFRALQAVGGSMLNPVAMSIITNTFTEPRERARAIGVWGSVVGLSMAAGPVLGGLLVDTLGWRAIFWVNVPIGITAFLLAWRFLPESRAPHPRRVDPVGQFLVFVTLASLTYGIIEGPATGWTSYEILGCFALGALALAVLLRYEPRRAEPLLDLRFFRSVPFSGATLIAVSVFATLAGFLFLNAIYLQDVRGLSPLRAGVWMLPMAAMSVVFAPLSGRLVAARGPRLPLVLAGAGMTAGLLPMTQLNAGTPPWLLLTCYVVFGTGFAMANSPITNTAVSGMPREQAGVAAAIASTSRQVGSALGVAVIGAAAAGAGPTGPAAWWIMVGLCVVVLLLGLATTGRWARSTTDGALTQAAPVRI